MMPSANDPAPGRGWKTACDGMAVCAVCLLAGFGCRTAGPAVRPDPAIDRPTAAARAAFDAGRADQAARLYREALDEARRTDRSLEIAACAYNLAACQAAQGHYVDALVSLDEARLEYDRSGAPPPELTLLEARILAAQGRAPEVVALALDELNNRPDGRDSIRLQWQLLLAQGLCDQGRNGDAEAALARLNEKVLRAAPPDLRAEAATLRARLALTSGLMDATAAAWDEAAGHWQTAGRFPEMVQALEQAAEAFATAGCPSEAADRAYRAARSLAASGLWQRALDAGARARTWADPRMALLLDRLAERCRAEAGALEAAKPPSARPNAAR